MPLPYGFTAKGKLDNWIKQQPGGTEITADSGLEALGGTVGRSAVSSAYRDFEANGRLKRLNRKTWITVERKP